MKAHMQATRSADHNTLSIKTQPTYQPTNIKRPQSCKDCGLIIYALVPKGRFELPHPYGH
jgi:hypothetical protein